MDYMDGMHWCKDGVKHISSNIITYLDQNYGTSTMNHLEVHGFSYEIHLHMDYVQMNFIGKAMDFQLILSQGRPKMPWYCSWSLVTGSYWSIVGGSWCPNSVPKGWWFRKIYSARVRCPGANWEVVGSRELDMGDLEVKDRYWDSLGWFLVSKDVDELWIVMRIWDDDTQLKVKLSSYHSVIQDPHERCYGSLFKGFAQKDGSNVVFFEK